MNKDRPKAQK
jgi:hypothetical protein